MNGPLLLVVGEEQVLVDRAVTAAVRKAREADPQAIVTELAGSALVPGGLDELCAPSLFGDARVVVLTGVQDCGKDVAAEVTGYLADPVDGITVVMTHAGGAKGKALLTALAKFKPQRVDCPKAKPGDRKGLVRREFANRNRRIGDDALDRLLDAVGSDLRELFGAAGQLMDMTDGTVTDAHVKAFHSGRAETSGFNVADKALEGNLSGALELARWAKATGVADVLVSSALASGLRLVAQCAGKNSSQAAAATGLPSWKVDRAVRQSRGWTRTGLTAAILAAADLDRNVKGGSVDPGYAIEHALLLICRARRTADDPQATYGEHGRNST